MITLWDPAFIGIVRGNVSFKRIDDLVKQTIVEHFKITVRDDNDAFDIWIAFLYSVNDHGAGLIEIPLSTVQKYLDAVLYRLYDFLFDIRFLHLITIAVADEKSGFIFHIIG